MKEHAIKTLLDFHLQSLELWEAAEAGFPQYCDLVLTQVPVKYNNRYEETIHMCNTRVYNNTHL